MQRFVWVPVFFGKTSEVSLALAEPRLARLRERHAATLATLPPGPVRERAARVHAEIEEELARLRRVLAARAGA